MDTWVPIETESGTWAVYWPRVRRIVNWYHKSELMLSSYRKVPIEEEMNLLEKLIRDPVYSMEVDWKKVREQAASNTDSEMRAYQNAGYGGRFDDAFLRYMGRDLGGKIIQSQRNKEKFLAINRAIQAESMKNVGTNIDRWQMGIDGAKFVRDVSADVFLIGVGILTGGSSLAAQVAIRGGTAGVIRGACKWQDTGEFGSGAVTMTGEVVAALVPVKFEGVPKALLVAGVKGVAEGGAALVAGEEFTKALEQAAWKAGGEVAKEALQSTAFKQWVSQKPVMVNGRLTGTGPTTAGRVAAKETSRVSKMALKALVGSQTDERTGQRVRSFVNRYTYFAKRAQELSLLAMAIVPPEGYTVGQWTTMMEVAR